VPWLHPRNLRLTTQTHVSLLLLRLTLEQLPTFISAHLRRLASLYGARVRFRARLALLFPAMVRVQSERTKRVCVHDAIMAWIGILCELEISMGVFVNLF
jgi:hypothetical protein